MDAVGNINIDFTGLLTSEAEKTMDIDTEEEPAWIDFSGLTWSDEVDADGYR